MNKYLDKPNAVPAQGMTPNEASHIGRAVGQSKFHHFKNNIASIFTLAFSTVGIAALLTVDVYLLAGTMGESLWNEFGEGGLAVFIPFALIMIAAFAHRLISKQSDDELKRSWLGRLVGRLCTGLLISVAILFSVTMLEGLHPADVSAVSADDEWSAADESTRSVIETKAAAFAAFIAPFAETIFALVSGGILIITAFLLMILMDWWYGAVKTLIVSRALHRELMRNNEALKRQRKDYSRIAAVVNAEAHKSPLDQEMEFALHLCTRGQRALSAQRKALPDRKLKARVKNPSWQEIEEGAHIEDPAELLKQRKEFSRALNIDSILRIIQRGQS